MTSSFQSTAFQGSARPVDTFVAPPSVQPKTGIESLAETLAAVNPNLQKFIGAKIEQEVEKEEAEGTELAIEDAAKNFKNISRGIKKTDGEDAARRLIGGSIFADRAYQRTKTKILGSNLESALSNSYATTQVEGQFLNAFSLESPQFQTWLEGERSKVVDKLSDINPTYVNKYFLPKLSDATAKITSHHIDQHQEYNFEKIKQTAVPLVEQIIVLRNNPFVVTPDSVSSLIQDFENEINDLGISGKERSSINDLLIKVINSEAEAKGLTGDGDSEGALDILEIAELFPYGPNGSSNLSKHPDFQSKANTLNRQIADYEYKTEKRNEIRTKREKEEDRVNSITSYFEALNNNDPNAEQIINDLVSRQPDFAPKIRTNVSALEGPQIRTEFLKLQLQIRNGDFGSEALAGDAVLDFLQSTSKSREAITLAQNLMKEARQVQNGLFTSVNRYISEYDTLSKRVLRKESGSNVLGQLFGAASTKQVNNRNEFADNLRQFVLDNPEVSEGEIFKEFKRLRDLGLEQLKMKEDINDDNKPPKKIPGVPDESPLKNVEPGAATEVTDEEARRIIEAENANQYLVQEGDTLTSIAEDLGTTVQKILEANNITNEDLINIGQQLNIPEINIEQPDINYSDDTRVQSIVKSAKQLGISPVDLAAVIAQESSFRPSVVSTDKATGKKYTGLIQFGPYEIAKYKIKSDMTFEEQMVAVTSFLKDRGVQPGHGPKEIYAAIFTGNVSNLDRGGADWADSNGTTVNKALPNLLKGGSKYKMAIDFLQQTGTYSPKNN